MVRSLWFGITETKLIEDGVRDERVGEQSNGFNKTTSGSRAWTQLIRSGTDTMKHRFVEVPWASTVVPRSLKDKPIARLFRLQRHRMPKSYREIVTYSRTAPYFSPAPLAQSAPAEDLGLMRYLRDNKCWEKGPHSWLSSLTHTSDFNLMLRHPSCYGAKWFATIGIVTGTACLALPLKEIKIKTKTYYVLDEVSDFTFLPICEVSMVEAMTFAWRTRRDFTL